MEMDQEQEKVAEIAVEIQEAVELDKATGVVVERVEEDLVDLEQEEAVDSSSLFVAEVAQLVEHDVANVKVAGSSPVFRSFITCEYIK